MSKSGIDCEKCNATGLLDDPDHVQLPDGAYTPGDLYTNLVPLTQPRVETKRGGPMTARYYEETPCEHGQVDWHYLCEGLPAGEYGELDHDESYECPGGLRRELTGVQVVEALRSDDWLADVDHHVPVRKPGRYLVIPLDE